MATNSRSAGMVEVSKQPWHYSGPVEMGQYPYAWVGHGVKAADGTRICIATSPDLAVRIAANQALRIRNAND